MDRRYARVAGIKTSGRMVLALLSEDLEAVLHALIWNQLTPDELTEIFHRHTQSIQTVRISRRVEWTKP